MRMEDLVDSLTRGNVTEVKVILASVAFALAFYQLALISVGYGKLRPPFPGASAASSTHRAVGDTIAVVIVVVAVMCVSYFELEGKTAHVVAAIALLATLAFKIAVIRRWHGLSGLLPVLGISVWLLLGLTWLTSAGDFFSET